MHASGEELVRKRGVTMDSFLMDDGWDNTSSLWQFDRDFPMALHHCGPWRSSMASVSAFGSRHGAVTTARSRSALLRHGPELRDRSYAIPWLSRKACTSTVQQAFELPQGAAQQYRAHHPKMQIRQACPWSSGHTILTPSLCSRFRCLHWRQSRCVNGQSGDLELIFQ